MSKLKALLPLLLLLLLPSRSSAQAVIVGQPCGAGGLNAISTTGVPVVCTGNPLVWTSPTGSGGGISSNSPVPANQAQGPRFNVKNYGAVGDAKKAFRVVVTNGSSTLTDTLDFNPWVAGDVGKKLFCYNIGANSGQNPLSVSIATISAFNSATSISIAPATGNGVAQSGTGCVWYTQDDTAAFTAAGVAAGTTVATANFKGFSEYTYPGTVYCPEGGYVVSGPVLNQQGGNPYSLGVSFVGAGRSACRFYVAPNVAPANSGWFMSLVQTGGQTISGFSVDCGFGLFSGLANTQFMNFSNTQHGQIRDVEVDSCGQNSASLGVWYFVGGSDIILDGVMVNGTSIGSVPPTFLLSGVQTFTMRNIYTTNPGQFPLNINQSGGQAFAGGPRSNTSAGVTVENSIFDEGGTTGAIQVQTGSAVSFISVTALAGLTTVMTVDSTSSVYLNNVNLTPFGGACSGGTRQALTLQTTAKAVVGGSSLAGCGSDGTGLSAAVSGTSASTFVDLGGNDIRNCPSGPPCPLVTPANFTTLGFNGGIVPKSTQTHTPNTCYAVTGNLLATAQNLCTILLDQNYQLLNMTAQSGGTTPTNSACATPPVITLSDGTRTATMTMTTAKTQWNSGVDAVTNINQIFASGATLTVSIGANTCATPPVNVSVNYNLQSALNQ